MQKSEQIAVLIPIRGRLNLLEKMVDSWRETTTGKSTLIFGIDDDDDTYEEFIKNNQEFTFDIWERSTSLQVLNRLAKKYCSQYKFIGFFEDDCVFTKVGWEDEIIRHLTLAKVGMVYCDIGQPDHLVGLPFVNSEFVEILGWFCPQNLNFLYADNFWKSFGDTLGILKKMDSSYMWHNHFSVCPSTPCDEVAMTITNSCPRDGNEFDFYMRTNFRIDVKRMMEELIRRGIK